MLRDDQTSNWLCSKRPVTSVRAPRAQDSGNQFDPDSLERRESLESSVGLAGNEHWIKIKALVHGVRQHGSYKRYARSFHRDVLTVRGLAQRGKLSTDDSVLNFLARLGDNGVCWHILSFWRATN